MEMNYCIYCGEKLNNDKAKFCPQCGRRLDNVEIILTETSQKVGSLSDVTVQPIKNAESIHHDQVNEGTETEKLEQQIKQLTAQLAELKISSEADNTVIEADSEVRQKHAKTVQEKVLTTQSAKQLDTRYERKPVVKQNKLTKRPAVDNLKETSDSLVLSKKLKSHISDQQSFVSRIGSSVKDTTRVYIGQKKTFAGVTNDKVYWEFGSPQLANRHMLITGKSGQGKTYFVQTMLYEMSQQNISSMVVDYTDSYLPKELDEEFTKKMGDRLQQVIVFNEKIPLNPFKLGSREIGGINLQESVEDMADRVVEVLDNIFRFGVQQRSTIKLMIEAGYRKYGEQYTFTKMKEQILESGDSVYGRISPILDRDPFTYDSNFDWSQYFRPGGKVTIMQIVNFQKTVQRVMTEFLLWDLFYYSRASGENLVYPVFLDEVQNLNFKPDSPTVKILREGRKFGWAGVFATQALSSIKGEVDAIYNCAEQVHFLPTDDQMATVASMISKNHKMATGDLRTLRKGECIVKGPMLESGTLINNYKKVAIDSLDHR